MSTDDLVDGFVAKISAFGVPIFAEDNTSRLVLFESKLPKRLPASFASFLRRYTFPSFDVLGISFFGWESDLSPYIAEASAPKGSLSELLLPHGYVQVGQPDIGSFDAVCFDLNQKSQNRECQIVQIDHEDILCNWKIRVSDNLWPSFVKLMETTLSATDAAVR
jgi:hypothetical protein